jgi:hypothetical protein
MRRTRWSGRVLGRRERDIGTRAGARDREGQGGNECDHNTWVGRPRVMARLDRSYVTIPRRALREIVRLW